MFQTREQRQKVKNILIASSIALSALFVVLLIYGVISVRPKNIDKASKLGQYYEFNSASLPSESNGLQKELGLQRNVFVGDKVEDDEVVGDVKEPASPVVHHRKPHIAILVTNLGLNPLSTELALSLPKEVSLGFLPYTTSLKSMLKKAHEDGHEIFMYLPFETKKYPDDSPGQMPLLLSLGDAENIHRMHNLLHSFDGYVGVYAAPNEVFTNNGDKAGAILAEMAGKKLKLLVSNNTVSTGEMASMVISSTVVIDAEPNIPAIKKQLDVLVELAKSGKPAIGYAGSYPVTIYALKAWLPTLEAMDIEVVPVTSMTSKGVK